MLQWNRRARLHVGDGKEALELTGFHMTFDIRCADTDTPNTAVIRITNLSEGTAQRIKSDFTTVILEAGYGNTMGILFWGDLIDFSQGKNGMDTWFEMMAADGDTAYSFAVMAGSLVGGSGIRDVLDIASRSVEEYGISKGYMPHNLPQNVMPRGQTFFGPVVDYMSDLAAATRTRWCFIDEQLQLVYENGYTPDEAVVLSPDSGLISASQSNRELEVKCLLNPRMKIGGRIQIDRSSKAASGIAQDGFYKILKVNHTGETESGKSLSVKHGAGWFTTLICTKIDDTNL